MKWLAPRSGRFWCLLAAGDRGVAFKTDPRERSFVVSQCHLMCGAGVFPLRKSHKPTQHTEAQKVLLPVPTLGSSGMTTLYSCVRVFDSPAFRKCQF